MDYNTLNIGKECMETMLDTAKICATNPGVNFSEWLTTNIQALFTAVVGVFGLIVIVKRKLMMGITLIILAGIAALFIFYGQDFAQKLAEIVMDWFK